MRIALLGVGALGSTCALFCRNLPAAFAFFDFDRVESKNALAQFFVKPSIGKNKAEALKLQLQNFWGVKSEAFGVRVADENVEALLGSADLLVDAFDNVASRLLVSRFARERGKPLVHAGLAGDGSFGLVRWDERFVPDAEDAPGQATCEGGEHLPMIGLLGATLARCLQDFVEKGERWDAMVSRSGVAVQR